MVIVKFFGLISIDNNIKLLTVNEGTVKEIFQQVINLCPSITERQLNQAIMFINKKEVVGRQRFSISLRNGDELVLLNPSSGG